MHFTTFLVKIPAKSINNRLQLEHSTDSGTNLPAIAEAIASAGGEKRHAQRGNCQAQLDAKILKNFKKFSF